MMVRMDELLTAHFTTQLATIPIATWGGTDTLSWN